jgi:hypothetical protein
VSTTVWTKDPASCVPPSGGRGPVPTREAVASVAKVVSSLKPDQWRTLNLGQGANGPLCFELAAVRVWAVRHGQAGPPVWLVVRRSLDATPRSPKESAGVDAGPDCASAATGRWRFRG